MSKNLQDLAKQHAIKAIELDKSGQLESAIFYYLEASQALIDYKQTMELTDEMSNLNLNGVNQKLNEYLNRAETLKVHLNKAKLSPSNAKKNTSPKIKTQFQKDIEKGMCMLSEALDEDTENNYEEALDLYTKTIEFYLLLKKSKNDKKSREEEDMFMTFDKNVRDALERAEEVKRILANSPKKSSSSNLLNKSQESLSKAQDDSSNLDNVDDLDDIPNEQPTSRSIQTYQTSKSGPGFTKEEISVLRNGSFINGRNYVPFLNELDTKERFSFSLPFTDKDGKLALSPSQRQRFARWVRPDEIFENPKLMMMISSFSVKQTCISDCSFVASLTVCAQYERKFNKTILSHIVYPKNRQGEPVYNPCGKYMITLNLNGCIRKIIIDDYLPVDNQNNLLCSITTNRGELWVSLLEKAYMKVMGGYDFPGSNSNIDLHALTNWIPERLALHGEHTGFNKESDFNRMFSRLHAGDVVITIATGPMSKEEEDRTGLVSTHAYAVLDIRKFKGLRLFQVKNPWSHLRWKGKFSEMDLNSWTPELKVALNYDPLLACNCDNGIFWIDYDSLIRFFDVFYLSWNPSLFPYTSSFHKKWSASEGPIKDRYNLGENPQYVLKLKPNSSTKKCTTWLLLTRHITDKADFAENKEYIALIVYKNNGKRIYYPMEPEPYKEGIRINSPHYLVKLEDDCSNPLVYTLVISQYEKYNSIFYTLRAYSTVPFDMNELKEPYNQKYFKRVTGKWQGKSAGGCSNHQDTYKNNPLFHLTIANSLTTNCIKIELKGPQQYSVGFDFALVSSNVNNSTNIKFSTGDYRKGFCVLPINNLPGGIYSIRPSTYFTGQEGPFIIEIDSTSEIQIAQVQ